MRGSIAWDKPRAEGYAVERWEIDGRATALLLIDLQVAHLDPEQGAGPSLQARFPDLAAYYYRRVETTLLPAVRALEGFFRHHGLPVIYACSGLSLASGRELGEWSWRAEQFRQGDPARFPQLSPPDDPGREIWAPVAPRPGDLVLMRQTLSPFNGTALDQYLRNMRIENLVVGGVLSNAAVETTARDAGDRGFNTILVEDACAALSPQEHADGTTHPLWYVVKSSGEVVREIEPLLQETSLSSG